MSLTELIESEMLPASWTYGPPGTSSVCIAPLAASVKVVSTGAAPLLNSSEILPMKTTVGLLAGIEKLRGTVTSPAIVEPVMTKNPLAPLIAEDGRRPES